MRRCHRRFAPLLLACAALVLDSGVPASGGTLNLRASASAGAGSESGALVASANPLLDRYRNWAVKYEEDAREAEAAAEKYAAMTQAIVSGPGAAGRAAAQTLKKLKAKELAEKVWDFEAKLRDPRPVNAAAAAAAAFKPYNKEWQQYTAARNQYLAAAAQHGLNAQANGELASQLQAHSRQAASEGSTEKAAGYSEQASALMKQVEGEQGLAKEYEAMAKKITGVLPGLYKMSYTAANFAAYQQNPTGSLPSTQLYLYTVAPPPMDLVQQAFAAQAAEAYAATVASPR